MRLLRLTNSSDTFEGVPEPQRATRVAEDVFTELTGEPIETVLKLFWPEPGLPDIVDRWIARYQPDVVFMRTSMVWCAYESVPLRLERRLGRLGRPLARLGFKLGGSDAMIRSPLFRAARRLALRTIGGDVYFRPDEAAEIVGATFRRVVAHESVIPALCGPGFARDASGTAAGRARAARRNMELDQRLTELARSLRIAYTSTRLDFDPAHLAPDGFHTGVVGQRVQGELEGKLITEAWLAAQTVARQKPRPASRATP
jgi:hypothetical protein